MNLYWESRKRRQQERRGKDREIAWEWSENRRKEERRKENKKKTA